MRDERNSACAASSIAARLIWGGILATVSPTWAEVVYDFDDGTAEASVIVVAGSEARPTLWLNAFEARPGGELITDISVTWGRTAGAPSGVPEHAPTTVLLYQDDPTNDGDPRTATLLVSVVLDNGAPLGSIDTGVFLDVPIPPTLVRETFFVAALYPDPGAGAPAPVDMTDPDTHGRSWVFSSAQDAVNTANLGSAVNFGGLIEDPPYAVSGNWLLRATGLPAFGDSDGDGDLDLLDFDAWLGCFSGLQNGPLPAECQTFDFDTDGDVDLADFKSLQLAFTGP